LLPQISNILQQVKAEQKRFEPDDAAKFVQRLQDYEGIVVKWEADANGVLKSAYWMYKEQVRRGSTAFETPDSDRCFVLWVSYIIHMYGYQLLMMH
jgi:hypothetical protein